MDLATEQVVETKLVYRTSGGKPNMKNEVVDCNIQLIVAQQILIIWTEFIVIVSLQRVDPLLKTNACSLTKTFSAYVETEDSSQCSQKSTIGHYLQKADFSPILTSPFSGTGFYTVFVSTPISSKWFLPFMFSDTIYSSAS
jgi:hypothetical protein